MHARARRYVYHTLRNSRHSVATIDEADVVYVYDYCYMMWILSDHHSLEHWWLRGNYEPGLKTGSYLLSSYRQALLHSDRRSSTETMLAHCIADVTNHAMVPPYPSQI